MNTRVPARGKVCLHQPSGPGDIGPRRFYRLGAPWSMRGAAVVSFAVEMPSAVPDGRRAVAQEIIAAFDEHPAWPIVGPERRRSLEGRERIVETAGDVGLP